VTAACSHAVIWVKVTVTGSLPSSLKLECIYTIYQDGMLSVNGSDFGLNVLLPTDYFQGYTITGLSGLFLRVTVPGLSSAETLIHTIKSTWYPSQSHSDQGYLVIWYHSAQRTDQSLSHCILTPVLSDIQ
jgi:hypothetical protein